MFPQVLIFIIDSSSRKEREVDNRPKGGLLNLFTSRHLVVKTLVLYFNWFANSFVYYGLTLNSGNLGGSYRLNFLINGLLEIPSYSLAMYFILKGGRKRPYITLLIVGGLALLATTLFERDAYYKNWPMVALAMIGKFCLTGEKVY